MDFIIPDLKTDRPNISGGLPPVFRAVPLMFFAAITLGGFFSVSSFFEIKALEGAEQKAQSDQQLAETGMAEITRQQLAITNESKAANELSEWLEGSRPVQPIGVTVARSMKGNATIDELNMERNPQVPAHLFLKLKVNGGDYDQIEQTLDNLEAINYQTYSANQVKGTNAVDFKATLIWKNNG